MIDDVTSPFATPYSITSQYGAQLASKLLGIRGDDCYMAEKGGGGEGDNPARAIRENRKLGFRTVCASFPLSLFLSLSLSVSDPSARHRDHGTWTRSPFDNTDRVVHRDPGYASSIQIEPDFSNVLLLYCAGKDLSSFSRATRLLRI